jgi:hypothetical protein
MSKLDEFQHKLEAHECSGEEAERKEALLQTIAEMRARGAEHEGDAGVFATIVEFLRGKILGPGDPS